LIQGNGYIESNGIGDITLANTISDISPSEKTTLNIKGPNPVILGYLNSYTGNTNVLAGKLYVNYLGTIDPTGRIVVSSGAALGGNASAPITNAITVKNGGIIEGGYRGTGTLTLAALGPPTRPSRIGSS
jgi:autotransporter-associated beta strand protein